MKSAIFILITVFVICDCEAVGFAKLYYRNTFLIKADISSTEAKTIGEKFGLSLASQKTPPAYHVFHHRRLPTRSHNKFNISLDDFLREDPKVELFHQEEYIERAPRSYPTNKRNAVTIEDSEWNRMWHLRPETVPNMGVYIAWQRGYTGRGITVAIIDDGADIKHQDLAANIDMNLSYNFVKQGPSPVHETYDLGHGTSCAGIVAAVKNRDCSVGVAHDSKIAVLRVLDKRTGTTASLEASALIHHLDQVDIYSNSWGPPDTGDIFAGSHDVTQAALLEGVTKGRGGLGAIYMWAAGNGGQNRDDCNCDSFVNSMYTISIQGVAMDTRPVYYAETCTAILASAYSGDDMINNTEIITSARNGGCRDDFHGTSASCASAAGIIALVLQANANLTWRDVQQLIVETSSWGQLTDGNFITNGAGKHVSEYFGFGLLNADAMVTAALNWTPVPTRHNCSSGNLTVPSKSRVFGSIVAKTHDLNCAIRHLEHVTVTVHVVAQVTGHLEIVLMSPQGTESKLLKPRPRDNNPRDLTWTFMTVHNWGESANGPWTLIMRNNYGSDFTLNTWQLDVYGTLEPPMTTSTSKPSTVSSQPTSSPTQTSISTVSSTRHSNGIAKTNTSQAFGTASANPKTSATTSSTSQSSGSTVSAVISGPKTSKRAKTDDSDRSADLTIIVCVTISVLVLVLLSLIIFMFYKNISRITPEVLGSH